MSQLGHITKAVPTETGEVLVLRLQYEIASILARAVTPQDALLATLKKIAESGGWDVGVFWSTESKSPNFQCEWHKPGVDCTALLNQVQAVEPGPATSLPIKALETGGVVWINDMQPDAMPTHADAAGGAKLYDALAFPLKGSETTQGVIGLFRHARYDLNDNARHVFELLGSDIGHFLQARATLQCCLERSFAHDDVTGLVSQTLLLDRGRQMLLLAERNDSSLAILRIELAFLASGHEKNSLAGNNELLRLAAERLSSCVRAYDTVARLANNEFVVLLPDMIDANDALIVAKKILAVMTQPLNEGNIEYAVNANIGIARHPQDGFDMPTLLHQAGQALQYSKSLGLNQSSLFCELAQ